VNVVASVRIDQSVECEENNNWLWLVNFYNCNYLRLRLRYCRIDL